MTVSADITLRILLALFSLVGLGDSLIFAYNAWRRQETEVACKDGTCIRLSKTPYAAVIFKIPNWAFGILYYFLSFLAAVTTSTTLVALSLIGAVLSCLLSVLLIYSLVVKLKAVCKLCYLAHAMNFAILIVWVVIMKLG
jgi:uncharacterized membrane protein